MESNRSHFHDDAYSCATNRLYYFWDRDSSLTFVFSETTMITLQEMQQINTARAKRWHPDGLEEWSPLEWAGAMCGEAGEAANYAKKLKRVEGKIRNLDKRQFSSIAARDTAEDYRDSIAREVADVIIYGILLMSRVNRDAEETIRKVFNQKSEEYGFPERL